MEVNVIQAKTDLSKLLHLLESKREESIIVSRYGKPIAKIIPYTEAPVEERIGILKGQPYISISQEEFDESNDEIAKLLTSGDL